MAKTITAAAQALLNRRYWYTAKLFTFTLVDGAVFRFCSGDIDLTVGGQTYSCGGFIGPYFEKTDRKAKTVLETGTSVASMVFDVLPGAWKPEGFTFAQALRFGLFDGADFLYQRINMAAPGDTSAGAIPMFGGLVGPINYSNSVAEFTILSYMDLLNINLPRNVYQAGCRWTLFDAGCTLDPAAHVVSGTVGLGISGTNFLAIGSAGAQVDGFFTLGKVKMISGNNAPLWRGVQAQAGSQFQVFPPFGVVPAIGDTFLAYPGCDKTSTTCDGKFGNLLNYGGFEFVPQAETAV